MCSLDILRAKLSIGAMKCYLSDRRVDGGYGWIVVLSSFCLIVITDGIFFSFGNLMVELIEEFNKDRANTALIASILIGISGLIGPFVGAFCDKYECRVIAIVGSILSCIGLLISSFATSIYFLYIFYGCLGGVGLGCIYLTGNIIVVQHVSKRRGLACGFTLCGSGVGTFAFNQFTRVLITEYGWRGTVMIEAGLCLQCVVFSLLLLPPLQERKVTSKICYNNTAVKVTSVQLDNMPNEHTFGSNNEIKVSVITNTDTMTANGIDDKNRFENENESEEPGIKNDADSKGIHEASHVVWLKQLFQSMFDIKLLTDLRFWIFLLSTVVVHLAFSVVITMTADRAVESGMTKYEASWLASSIGITNTVSRIILGALADRKFVSRIIMASVLLLLAGISTALSFLLKTFATRMIGTSMYGFCIVPTVNSPVTLKYGGDEERCAMNQFKIAGSVKPIPLVSVIAQLVIGGYIALCPLVLAEMFSTELIAKSLGLYLFALGISTIAANPIGGLLFDKTGNYDVTFAVAGSQLIIAGLLLLVLRFIHIRTRRK